ncbi:hypothetical protein PLESTB_000658200 [Pleodorina starrii]|uniref:Uncharacterized protein n=1 Tax=Pleodorina starrii TaxID=330485 RepID=A0A9W6F1U8_9CHLO|nr:hypothetical protein PLESTB_000658200 [Pleodorina starrii]
MMGGGRHGGQLKRPGTAARGVGEEEEVEVGLGGVGREVRQWTGPLCADGDGGGRAVLGGGGGGGRRRAEEARRASNVHTSIPYHSQGRMHTTRLVGPGRRRPRRAHASRTLHKQQQQQPS